MHDTQASSHDDYAQPQTGGGQMDDINIPLVAVAVALFAVLLAVLIVALQAWFANAQTREQQAKTFAQEDPQPLVMKLDEMKTDLGRMQWKQRAELQVGPNAERLAAATTGTAPASNSGSLPPTRKWIPIDTAMKLVSRDYHGGAQP